MAGRVECGQAVGPNYLTTPNLGHNARLTERAGLREWVVKRAVDIAPAQSNVS